MSKMKKYLWAEIGIEFKACLYFYAFLFFVCIYSISIKEYSVSILHMGEMILSTYTMGYIQVFLLDNFDESEKLNLRNVIYIVLCTSIYTALNYFLNWTSKSIVWNIGFFAWVFACYLSIFFVYKLKRSLDTEKLNKELLLFQQELE